ncbi:DUF5977 domain-containing protein [Flavihumibacter sp. RY-1]|uniref:DUF5977 domain-containing protein n=1 Tax=Flavihumibacter fluminis TaxID=2909236 RepID=A0ABS9BEP7_9BACT|nr:DUF5977 domain-containing protein [Flavihumibacter fluminis]
MNILVKHFFVFVFLNLSFIGFSQNLKQKTFLINSNTISPEAASIQKFGNIPVNYNTGVPNISIPITTIQISKISLPISIDYHAGGIRADEVASSVGLGWSLNAGGVISRSLSGQPDETGVGLLYMPDVVTAVQNPNQYYDYLYRAAAGEDDDSPDIFSYSSSTGSGQFMLKKDGGIFQLPLTNNKIEKYFDGNGKMKFNITDENGIVYKYERLETITIGPVNFHQPVMPFTNSWRLTKIIDPNTLDEITFTYEDACGTHIIEKSFNFSHFIGTTPGCTTGSGYEMSISNSASSSSQTNMLTTSYVKEIAWREGKIEFENSCDRVDRPGVEKRLRKIKIYSKVNSNFNLIREIATHQSYFFYNSTQSFNSYQNSDPRNYRLRLDSISDVATGINGITHKFEYNSTPLPSYETFAQDFFGFSNGQWSNQSLIHQRIEKIAYVNLNAYDENYTIVGNANRFSNTNFMNGGMINKIVYPTGGYTEFYFEPHSYLTGNKVYLPKTVGLSAHATTTAYHTATFTTDPIIKDPRFNLTLSSYNFPNVSNPISLKITDLSNGAVILSIANMDANSILSKSINHLPLLGGRSYKIEFFLNTTNNPQVTGNIEILYEYETSTNEVKYEGGMRIKELKSYTGNGILASHDLYKYGSNESGFGKLLTPYTFFSMMKKKIINGTCCYLPGTAPANFPKVAAESVSYSAGSLNPASQFSGSSVLYDTVVIYKNDYINNTKLKLEFHYKIFSDNNLIEAPGQTSLNMHRLFPNNWKNGKLIRERHFRSDPGNSYSILNEKENFYSERRIGSIKGLKASWKIQYDNMCWLNAGSLNTDVEYSVYDIYSGIYQLDSTRVTNYELNGSQVLKNLESFGYLSSGHLNPVSITKLNSKGQVVLTNLRYPSNFVSSGNVYEKMVNRNIIGPVVEAEELIGGVSTSTYRINYKDWFNDTKILDPESIQFKFHSNPFETKETIYSRDTYGNILQVGKANDFESYYFGHLGTKMHAKVSGASSNNIFFDGFEEITGWSNANGGNNYDMPIVFDQSRSKTGKVSGRLTNTSGTKRYCHSTKWLSINNTTSRKYKYSGWVYSTGTAADLYLFMKRANETNYFSYVDYVTVVSSGSWKYVEKIFDVPADVRSISLRVDINSNGTVWFDDLRLHPADAQMTSYTFDPLVGITSITDINNNQSYYEYDLFKRLYLVKDKDGNVIKKYCYNYTGQPVACDLFTNDDKSGSYTRNNCGAGSTGGSVYVSIPPGMFSSIVSKADANNQATAYGQAQANATGTCTSSNINLVANNTVISSTVYIQYYNTVTGQQYNFSPSYGFNVPLGSIPSGTYHITFGVNDLYNSYYFSLGCGYYGSGSNYTFYNIVVDNTCSTVSISSFY